MTNVVFILMLIAMLAVVVVLMIGVGGFAQGGKFNARHGNKMMRLRIIVQAIAVILIVLYVYLRNQGAS